MSKTSDAVQWVLAAPGRSLADASRMYGVAASNLSVAVRCERMRRETLAMRSGNVCPMCGGPTLAPQPPDPVTDCAPGFVCVVPTTVPHMTPLMQELGVVTSEEAKEIARKMWI